MDPGRNENSALIELADFFSDMLMFLENGLALKRQAIH